MGRNKMNERDLKNYIQKRLKELDEDLIRTEKTRDTANNTYYLGKKSAYFDIFQILSE